MKNGKLIVIEGSCDGIGKTTQYNLLIENLKKDNIEVVSHHFPSYNTNEANGVERYLNKEFGNINELSPYFINSLYAHDRAVTWYSYLKNEYENGKVILLDRYTTSSLIYQSALIENLSERKKFIDYVIDFEYNKIGIKKPDAVIFLNADFDLVTKLRNERQNNDGIKNDIHESNLEFMKKVYENAIFISNYLKWNIINCEENNNFKSIDDIQNEIYKLVKKII